MTDAVYFTRDNEQRQERLAAKRARLEAIVKPVIAKRTAGKRVTVAERRLAEQALAAERSPFAVTPVESLLDQLHHKREQVARLNAEIVDLVEHRIPDLEEQNAQDQMWCDFSKNLQKC